MSALKYVCLSDLHLGAAYSILTGVAPDGRLDLARTSPSLASFGRALREQVSRLAGDGRPTLILLGDVLDMGLSPTGAVVRAFRRFVEALFPANEPPLFADQLLYVPGNHDHHLWRGAQDDLFLEKLELPEHEGWLPDMIEHTPLFGPPSVSSRLLTRVMRGFPHLASTRVDIVYPNLGLLDEASGRCVMMHHGHYVDTMYLALSSLNSLMANSAARPKTVSQIERQNGAWVDFVWSDLGGAGAVGQDAMTLYRILRDAGESHRFTQLMGDRLLQYLGDSYGVSANSVVTHGVTVSNLLRAAIDASVGRSAESERSSYDTVLSDGAVADLRWYLGHPLRNQLVAERKLSKVKEAAFIFGHTHKPFQAELVVEGYALPMSIYNTGGWVMDQPTMAPTQGASAMFIDDALNVATQRLFNDPVHGSPFREVQVLGTGGFRDRDNPLLERVSTALAQTAAAWKAFSDSAAGDLRLRADQLLTEFFDPKLPLMAGAAR